MTQLIPKLLLAACLFFAPAAAPAAATDVIAAKDVVEPKAFIKLLKPNKGKPAPLLIQVGYRELFDQGSIPGSIFAGSGDSEGGLKLLEKELKKQAKDKPVLLYCGCCPWAHCTNVSASYTKAKALGYKNVKVLRIAENFDDDWVKKGYPTKLPSKKK